MSIWNLSTFWEFFWFKNCIFWFQESFYGTRNWQLLETYGSHYFCLTPNPVETWSLTFLSNGIMNNKSNKPHPKNLLSWRFLTNHNNTWHSLALHYFLSCYFTYNQIECYNSQCTQSLQPRIMSKSKTEKQYAQV